MMLDVSRELWSAGRALRRSPGFALVTVLTLGLAIGACTAIYGVVYGVTVQALPYPHPEQIVQLWQLNQRGVRDPFSDPNFEDLRAQTRSFQAVAEFNQTTSSVIAGTMPLRVRTASVSRDFFDVLATSPSRGRRFAAEELQEGAAPVVIISQRLWQEHFAGVSDLSAAALRIRGKAHAVVGVLPAGFDSPAGVDVWLPREATTRNPFRTGHNWRVIARVRNGVTLEAARGEATSVARRLRQELGDATWMTDVAVVPLRDQLVGDVRPVLRALLGAMALLLAVACANLSNLLLARVSGRRRELAVRAALGATRVSMALPMIAESLILAVAGGVLGLALARLSVFALRVAQPANLPRLDEVSLSFPVLAFALGVTALSAVALGGVAMWRARLLEINEWLKDRHGAYTGGTSAGRLRSTLVVAQLTAAMVLLVGAGLLGRSLVNLLSQDPGFRTEDRLAIDLASPGPEIRPTPDGLELSDPASLPKQAQLNQRLIERLRALPGVLSAGGASRLPMTGIGSNGRFLIVRGDEGRTLRELAALANDATRTGSAVFVVASGGYFGTMGIPLVRGRLFGESDGADAPHAAVISESLARTRWPAEDPIGVRIQFGGMDGDLREFTIVGIVGDVRETGLESPPRPTFYADYRQRPLSTFNFSIVLHTAVPPASLVNEARTIISEVLPEVPPRFRTITEVIDVTVAGRKFTLVLTALFAGAAMLLAVLGVYGVLSYLVAQRHHEFGVRMALGAQAGDVWRLVLKESARLVGAGLVLGSTAAFVMSRVLSGMLFGIRPTDPATYIAVATALALAAFVACQVPALRATRADPVTALRAD